jgi:hypothetical protein
MCTVSVCNERAHAEGHTYVQLFVTAREQSMHPYFRPFPSLACFCACVRVLCSELTHESVQT